MGLTHSTPAPMVVTTASPVQLVQSSTVRGPAPIDYNTEPIFTSHISDADISKLNPAGFKGPHAKVDLFDAQGKPVNFIFFVVK